MIHITLEPTSEQATALLETRRQSTEVFNTVAVYGRHGLKNIVTLHDVLYWPLFSKNFLQKYRISNTFSLTVSGNLKDKKSFIVFDHVFPDISAS